MLKFKVGKLFTLADAHGDIMACLGPKEEIVVAAEIIDEREPGKDEENSEGV